MTQCTSVEDDTAKESDPIVDRVRFAFSDVAITAVLVDCRELINCTIERGRGAVLSKAVTYQRLRWLCRAVCEGCSADGRMASLRNRTMLVRCDRFALLRAQSLDANAAGRARELEEAVRIGVKPRSPKESFIVGTHGRMCDSRRGCGRAARASAPEGNIDIVKAVLPYHRNLVAARQDQTRRVLRSGNAIHVE